MTLPPLPKKVEVLGLTYRVVQKARVGPKWDTGWGWIEHETQTIYVSKEATLAVQWRTLWHEALHLLEFAFGFTIEDDEDADVNRVDLFASAVQELLRRNPSFALR